MSATQATPSDERKATVEQQIVLRAQDIFRNRRSVSIEHNGEIYRLQLTRAGKLILTK